MIPRQEKRERAFYRGCMELANNMYDIFCDETWTPSTGRINEAYRVYYGVAADPAHEADLITEISGFMRAQDLALADGDSRAINWERVESESVNAALAGRPDRYKEMLDIFFAALSARRLSFGYMFIKSSDYVRIMMECQAPAPDGKPDLFYMLYFQFLYRCFMQTQSKSAPSHVYIDYRNLDGRSSRPELGRLSPALEQRLAGEPQPFGQMALPPGYRQKLARSVTIADLATSKQSALIQLADLCAGCVRYVLEHQFKVPRPAGQMTLFDESMTQDLTSPGRRALAEYFYRKLRSLDPYREINLLGDSDDPHFNIFPFQPKS
jgi:hypothetical protein